jgi:hypothetical protein
MDQNQTVTVTKHELFARPYNLGDLLSLAWKLFSDNFKAILIITIIVYVPLNLISALFPVPAPSGTTPNELARAWLDIVTSAAFILTTIITMLASVLVPLAIALLTRKYLDGQTLDYQAALKQAIPRWLPGIGTTGLMSLLLLGLSLFLIIPGVIFAIYWAFAIYVVMLNNKSGMAALNYSRQVVRGRWWRTLGYFIVFGLISGMASWVINIPLAAYLSNPVVNFISSLLANIIFSFITVATVLLFLNLESNRPVPATKQKL